MKQQITFEQWKEISSQKAGNLIGKMGLKFNPDTSFTDFPSIGKMIEFIYEKKGEKEFNFNFGETGIEPTGFFISLPEKETESPTGKDWGGRIAVAWRRSDIWKNREIVGTEKPGELCDVLWECVKEILIYE